MDAQTARFSMVKKRHKETLYKAIEENKADEKIIPFLKKIAEKKNYFTSSSCCGRVMLLGLPGDGTKKESYFYKKWHRTVSFDEVWKAINEFKDSTLHYMVDPFIFHIGCGNLEDAKKLLRLMQDTGIKRGGIIVAKPGKFMIELQGTDVISFPVKIDNKLLVSREFLEKMVEFSNIKIENNFALLEKFEENALKELE